MFCSKCGNQVNPGTKFCNKCGNPINNNNQNIVPNQYNNQVPQYNNQINNININNQQPNPNQQYNYSINNNYNNYQPNNKSNKKILLGIGIGAAVLLVLIVVILATSSGNNYYFDENENSNSNEIAKNESNKKGKYKTAIIYDHTYDGVNVSTKDDAIELIIKDSVDQKVNCPKEIRAIEDDIIKKYNIAAVNLCEMDVGFAKELGNVFKKIYDEYPSVRRLLTNLTLVNGSMQVSYIAAFMPMFTFAKSGTGSGYPWVMKTQILLNTSYFLNPERLKGSVESGSKEHHFPPNATIYSPVAHEMGHYLSFLAMMKYHHVDSFLMVDSSSFNEIYDLSIDFKKGDYSLMMIKEAYQNYVRDTGDSPNFDEWRESISKYAVAKDNNGDYIYDETIAESFHDVYLNGDKAATASKYVIAVLKSKLNG